MKKELLCPDSDGFNYIFGIKLLKYLGATNEELQMVNENWCWKDFAKHFSHYKEKAEKYFENAKTGDPALAAYEMWSECGSSKEWAERVIENAKIGDPAYAAYLMCYCCGSSREWAEKIIENAKIGNPAWAAYLMCHYCKSSQEWYEKVVEKNK